MSFPYDLLLFMALIFTLVLFLNYRLSKRFRQLFSLLPDDPGLFIEECLGAAEKVKTPAVKRLSC